MTSSRIEPATLVRLERAAGLVRSTVQQTFVRLQCYLLTAPDLDMLEERGLSFDRHKEHLDASTQAITLLAKEVLSNLFFMCELITQNSNPPAEVRERFANILRKRPDTGSEAVIDLRTQRLLRLPINHALEIILGDLESSCAEINKRVYSVVDRHTFEAVALP